MKKKKKKPNKKTFHSHYKVRPIRMSDENWEWLNKIKKGTWNHTFNQLRKTNNLNKKI